MHMLLTCTHRWHVSLPGACRWQTSWTGICHYHVCRWWKEIKQIADKTEFLRFCLFSTRMSHKFDIKDVISFLLRLNNCIIFLLLYQILKLHFPLRYNLLLISCRDNISSHFLAGHCAICNLWKTREFTFYKSLKSTCTLKPKDGLLPPSFSSILNLHLDDVALDYPMHMQNTGTNANGITSKMAI